MNARVSVGGGLMTISTTDFPIWFFTGFYGGLVCCVLSIAISLRATYAHIRRRVIPRRLVMVVVVSLASSMCLLGALIWFSVRFNTRIALAEIVVLVCSVVFFGWLLPIGTTVVSSVASGSRFSMLSRQEKQRGKRSGAQWSPPRYQSGVVAPFVFSAETPWGWLEYRSGNFQGQQLALKRSIITLGRAEDSDIWLDDDMASRRHAEVAWDNDVVYLTDCESLNSTRLNGRRVRGSVLLSSEDIIEIGTQRFLFILAEQKMVTTDQYDPLVNHKWRSSFELQDSRETTEHKLALSRAKTLLQTDQVNAESKPQQIEPDIVTSKLHTPPSLPAVRGVLLIGNGELAGRRFFLQSLSVLVGSAPNCDLVVPDLELAPQHARFIREAQGDYVQDLSGQSGTLINGVPVQGMQLLQPGDHLHFGSFHLIYLSALQASEGPVPYSHRVVPANGPMPLRLPSRPKES
jgi:pSer/pThr/pTyr-binding forkhead associated (FHA) protein